MRVPRSNSALQLTATHCNSLQLTVLQYIRLHHKQNRHRCASRPACACHAQCSQLKEPATHCNTNGIKTVGPQDNHAHAALHHHTAKHCKTHEEETVGAQDDHAHATLYLDIGTTVERLVIPPPCRALCDLTPLYVTCLIYVWMTHSSGIHSLPCLIYVRDILQRLVIPPPCRTLCDSTPSYVTCLIHAQMPHSWEAHSIPCFVDTFDRFDMTHSCVWRDSITLCATQLFHMWCASSMRDTNHVLACHAFCDFIPLQVTWIIDMRLIHSVRNSMRRDPLMYDVPHWGMTWHSYGIHSCGTHSFSSSIRCDVTCWCMILLIGVLLMYDITHWCMTWLLHLWDDAAFYVQWAIDVGHDSFIHETTQHSVSRYFLMYDVTFTCDVTQSNVTRHMYVWR